MPESTTLSVTAAAKRIGVSRDSLARCIKAGKPIATGNGIEVYAITVGGMPRISVAQLDQLLGVAS